MIMAEVRSIFQFIGTLGGINFFNSGGQTYARKSTSLTRERVMKDKAFAGARRTMSEFGAASAIAGGLRKSIPSLWSKFKEPHSHNILNRQFKKIINLGNGELGRRSFCLSQNKEMLSGLKLAGQRQRSQQANLEVNFSGQSDIILEVNKLTQDLPTGATHLKIHLAAVSFSDFFFDHKHDRYKPSNPQFHGLNSTNRTAHLPVDSLPASFVLNCTLPLPQQPTDVSIIIVVAISYSQEVNGILLPLQTGNAMEILKVL